MTHTDLVELSDHHEKQAGYYRRVGDAVKDDAITQRHHAHADWHARHAENLKHLARSFATGFPGAVAAAAQPSKPVALIVETLREIITDTPNTPGDDAIVS